MACLATAIDAGLHHQMVKLQKVEQSFRQHRFAPPADEAGQVDVDPKVGFKQLRIDQIEPFENGPRLLANPKLSAIKASINASGGLTRTLPVTKRSGSGRYVCHQGGNTRLLALKELYQETGDPRFGMVWVEVKPYTNDVDLALLHHRENTCRGDLTFIEDAFSTYRLFQMYGDTSGVKTTARSFVNHMRDQQGSDLTVEAFSRMKYAVEVLYQHLPACLVQGGMPLGAVRRLIKLRLALKDAWTDRSIGTVAHFDETFYGLLARQDEDLAATYGGDEGAPDRFPDFRIAIDWTLFQQDFQYEVSVYAGVSYQTAGAWIAAAFRRVNDTSDLPDAQAASPHAAATPDEFQSSPNTRDLRAAAYDVACRIAAAGDLGHLVEPSREGFGYRVTGSVSPSSSSASKARWWALVLATSSGEEVARCQHLMDEPPSFAGLTAEGFASISALFAHHANIARAGG